MLVWASHHFRALPMLRPQTQEVVVTSPHGVAAEIEKAGKSSTAAGTAGSGKTGRIKLMPAFKVGAAKPSRRASQLMSLSPVKGQSSKAAGFNPYAWNFSQSASSGLHALGLLGSRYKV